MKTLKVIRIIGAIVFGAATLYFLFEGDYINAILQFLLFLLLGIIPLLFYNKNEERELKTTLKIRIQYLT